jgi:hypothetical protein
MRKDKKMHKGIRKAAIVLLGIGIASPGFCAGVRVSGAWFRALPSGLPAGGYFLLRNSGIAPVELVAARSSACGMVMLHRSVESGGMSRMVDVKGVVVPPGATIEFAPGGNHLMCMNPSGTMRRGGHVKVTLVFADHGTADADFNVKGASGN